jgi:hypothetical protein
LIFEASLIQINPEPNSHHHQRGLVGFPDENDALQKETELIPGF